MQISDKMVQAALRAWNGYTNSGPVADDWSDAMQAALAAALAVDGVALQGWHDISTAPHDGTRILLWASAWHAPCSGSWYGSDWRQVYDLPTFAHSPTHWQPLPQPPAASDREERMSPPKEKP